jgi:Alpha-aminoadipate carrier protein LysW-like, globular domain
MMLTTDCPICDATATLDADLTALTCDDCGVDLGIVTTEPNALQAAA